MNFRQALMFSNEVFLTPSLSAIFAFVGFYHSSFTLTASIGFSLSLFFGICYLKRLRYAR